MAYPTFVAVGTASGGTGTTTPGLPSGFAGDDLHLLFTNTKRAEAQVSVPGFTFLDAAIPTADNKISVFYRHAVAGDTAPTVPDSGDHTYSVIIGLRNPNGGQCVIETDATAAVSTATTAVSWPAVTTAGIERFIVHALADGRDATGARFSGQTNADLLNLTERFDNGITSNDGGGLVIVTGEDAAAGSTGNTTGTLTSATQALITIAIYAPGGGGTDATANGQTLTYNWSLIPGTASGQVNATANGQVLPFSYSLIAGNTNGEQNRTAAGQSLPMAWTLIPGSATAGGNATASGQTLGYTWSSVPGAAAGVRNGTTSGQILTASWSLIPGSASGNNILPAKRLQVFYYYEPEATEPDAPKQKRKVTRKAVKQAIRQLPEWAAQYYRQESLAEVVEDLPDAVPMPSIPDAKAQTYYIDMIALWLEQRAQAERDDEEDVGALLLAAA